MTDKDQTGIVGKAGAGINGDDRSRWYSGYFFLALVNIVTISAGTMLNYHLVRQYENANELNRYWSAHLSDFAELETLISLANAPGNDIFVSLNPDYEERRLDVVRTAIARKFEEIRAGHAEFAASTHMQEWDELLKNTEDLIDEMGRETHSLLNHFRSGDMAAAARGMAIMDGIYAKTVLIVNQLEREAQEQQRASLADQVQLAEYMRNVQYVIGGLIAMLVIGIAAHGYRLARQMRRDDQERAVQVATIEASEQRFRELTEGSIQGIIVHRDGVPMFVNNAWAHIHGFSDLADAYSVENIAELVVPQDRDSVRDIQYALQYGVGSTRQYEYRARRPDGKIIWLECLERVVNWEGKIALQATVIDATERKVAEDGLRAAMLEAEQATSARTRFFAAASHDLRQPLHAISLYLPLLQKRMANNENSEMLGAIQNSCNAMRSLLDSLLDISRLDAGVIEPKTGPISLLDVFDQLGMEFTPQAAAKGLELRVVPADYWIRSDIALLERILRNLLTNAIRYTEKGKILLGARRCGAFTRIEVWDSGIGIPPDKLKHIFEEFYQADNPERDRSRGLGLGLAIIDRLATLLDHKLDVRSQPGKGSVFSITLPAAEEPVTVEAFKTDIGNEVSILNGRLAMLIDDDPIVLEGTQAMLEDWGLRVINAGSVREAVGQIEPGHITPDVIIADLRLRGGETGLDAVVALNENLGQSVPAVIVTGDTDPDRIKQATASGNQILHKPVEPEELRLALLRAVNQSSPLSASGDAVRENPTRNYR